MRNITEGSPIGKYHTTPIFDVTTDI